MVALLRETCLHGEGGGHSTVIYTSAARHSPSPPCQREGPTANSVQPGGDDRGQHERRRASLGQGSRRQQLSGLARRNRGRSLKAACAGDAGWAGRTSQSAIRNLDGPLTLQAGVGRRHGPEIPGKTALFLFPSLRRIIKVNFAGGVHCQENFAGLRAFHVARLWTSLVIRMCFVRRDSVLCKVAPPLIRKFLYRLEYTHLQGDNFISVHNVING